MKKPPIPITRTNINRVFKFTDEVVENYPDRLAGTEACRQAADRIKQEFTKYCDRSSVQIEDFEVHPRSFLKYIPALVVMYFIGAVLLYFGKPLPAFVILGLAIFMFYAQFARYWEIIDPYFPKATGYNIIGSIEPEGEVKQQIVVSGHHDAAYVFQLLTYIPKYYAMLINAGILVLIIAFLVSLAALVLALVHVIFPTWIAIVLMALGIFQIPLAFFTTREVSPAAGDNMVAVAVAAETAGIFRKSKKPLRHTRLIFASFDAEEAGLRGARDYCRKHGRELLDTKTYVFNIDTLYKLEDLHFLTRDLNGSVKLSLPMAQDCVDIAAGLGYKAGTAVMPFGAGATDAAEFGKLGVEATNMAGISFDIKKFNADMVYHTPDDFSAYIEPALVEASLKIITSYILQKDNQV